MSRTYSPASRFVTTCHDWSNWVGVQANIKGRFARKIFGRRAVATILDDVYAMTIIEVRDGKAVLNVGAEGSEQDRKMRDSPRGTSCR